MLIYKIRLPQRQDPEAFVTFMREEYFPAVHRGSIRVGRVTALALLQGTTTGTTHEFLWHIGGIDLSSGVPPVDNDEVQHKFDSFGVSVNRLGSYVEVAAWHETNRA